MRLLDWLFRGRQPQQRPDATVYYRKGLACYAGGNYAEVIANHNEALKCDPNNAAAYSHGFFALAYSKEGVTHLQHTGNYDLAIEYFTNALAIEPAYQDAWFNRANAFELIFHYDDAITDYTKCFEARPI